VKNAVLIPREAVFVSSDGPYVQRRGPLRVERVSVRLGGENDKFIQVLHGLDAGDRVLVAKDEEEEEKA
jgi:multidrug efflux pump subunit AcrA (membrane-fusion protein)